MKPHFLIAVSMLMVTGYCKKETFHSKKIFSVASSGSTMPIIEQTIQADFENQFNNSPIDIEKYMKCFTNIPDSGAIGAIEIFTDIPVNSDPMKFFNWNNGSPGHVFIQLSKYNGSAFVTQNIGFYPESGWKTLLSPIPTPGKFVDNAHHEFNASMKINLGPAQLRTAVARILYLSGFVSYDIDGYNCADWALDIFNVAVKAEQRLTDITRYQIPGGATPTTTPQTIYIKLQQMKKSGGPMASGIMIPLLGWVGSSKGPCN